MMDEWECKGFERLREAIIQDARIGWALSDLGEDGKAFMRDSLVAVLQGERDEFFFQLFERVAQRTSVLKQNTRSFSMQSCIS